MEKLILIANGEYYKFNTLEELKNYLIPNLDSLTKEDVQKCMFGKVFGFSIMNNLQILDTKKGVYGENFEISNEEKDFERAIIIDNLDTYILSLCKYNIITLLEEKDNRTYTKDIKVELKEDNYIVVNAFANEILLSMVGDVK